MSFEDYENVLSLTVWAYCSICTVFCMYRVGILVLFAPCVLVPLKVIKALFCFLVEVKNWSKWTLSVLFAPWNILGQI